MTPCASFDEFWPLYLRAHARPLCRALHYMGTSLGLLGLGLFLAGQGGLWLAAALIFSYGFAWAGHFLVEDNQPLTFRYPLWSLKADFYMYGLWLSRRLGPELRKAGVA